MACRTCSTVLAMFAIVGRGQLFDHFCWPRSIYTGSTFNYVRGFHQKRQPLVASEYGGIAALDGDLDTSWSFKDPPTYFINE